jgi:FhaA, N-terminal domain/FHA domain
VTVLRNIEQKIEALFEGVFGRAFRTNVQPVELARKLAKEMDDNRTVSVSRTYVPNEYTVYLSPPDREQFEGYEEALLGELQDYLGQHAMREDYALMSSPKVLMESDADLAVGEFGIATRMVQREGAREAGAPPPQPAPGATMIYKPEPIPPEPEPDLDERPRETPPALLRVGAGEHRLDGGRLVIGRSRDCDIRLTDPNVSRRHGEVRREGDSFWVVDLDSTNGIEVNGRRSKRARLHDGDTITMGATELVFEQRSA